MKSVSECKAIQAYLRHPGAELWKFVVGQLLVDHLGDHSDDLPVNSGLHNRDGEVIYIQNICKVRTFFSVCKQDLNSLILEAGSFAPPGQEDSVPGMFVGRGPLC